MMLQGKAPIAVTGAPEGVHDTVLPFAIDKQDMRGRLVRLGPALNQVLAAHAYPDAVAAKMAEMLALTGLLGSILKSDGQLTVQAKGSGPVRLMVADYVAGGALRGYCGYDAAATNGFGVADSIVDLFGTGYLALTIEQGGERYQGIVELDGETLADCAIGYFERSEQTPTRLRIAARRDEAGWWRAGGLMLQHLARGEEGGRRLLSPDQKEDWQRVSLLMMTVADDELTAAGLSSPDLLYRLFHEEGVRVFPTIALARGCRCTREHIAGVLASFGDADLADMVEDGKITVNCEFCNKAFVFDPSAGL